MTYKEKLLKRFEELDKRPHTDYRLIALNLGVDYHKLSNKNKKLDKEVDKWRSKYNNLKTENEELKEDKAAIYKTACDLVWYLEDTEKELREQEEIDNFIAVIQNYSK